MNHQTQTSIMENRAERNQLIKNDRERSMNKEIPNCYYTRSIFTIIDNCIEEGYSNYSNLLLCDKELLIAECLSELGSDSFDEAINLRETLEDFIEILKTGKSEIAVRMINKMRMTTSEHFTDVMNALFEERKEFIKSDHLRECGYIEKMDSETGEKLWRKVC